jgi:hypothetical protein
LFLKKKKKKKQIKFKKAIKKKILINLNINKPTNYSQGGFGGGGVF